MLPGGNGMDICRKVRQQGIQTPILMLTALGSVDNIVMGLDSGADDYLTKPFKIAELLARVRSLLRRAPVNAAPGPSQPVQSNMLVFSNISLNLDEKNARRDNRTIELTATEFRLLEYLMRNPRKVLSRMDILEKVWGYDFNMNTKSVDVYINYLRKKLETTASPRIIHTVVGMGYILKEE
jgi:DNA-binding response OmpR family regulator